MITLQHIYWLAGTYLVVLAWQGLRDRANPKRFGNAAFWGLMALMLLAGERLPSELAAAVVVALALLAGLGAMGRGPATDATEAAQAGRRSEAHRLGNRLFIPALLIPGTTLALVLMSKYTGVGAALLEPGQSTVIALGIACVAAVAAACVLARQSPLSAVQ